MLAKINLQTADSGEYSRILDCWSSHKVLHIQGTGLQLEAVRDFYENIARNVGTISYIAEDVQVGDRTKQRVTAIWTEVRYDPKFPGGYRHSQNAQPLHTDGSYIPEYPNASLMCCVRNAATGGETVFVDSKWVRQALSEDAPELLSALEQHPITHTRSGSSRTEPVIRQLGSVIKLNWNYYCVSPDTPSHIRSACEAFFKFLQTSDRLKEGIVPVKLSTGDAVLWKDDEVLHGRNAFVASETSERFLWKCALEVGMLPAHARVAPN
jgi:alpha-ketoglutarate-dependent taurine dioxygenase